ncbi:ATP-binding protein [Agrobacterium sp. S2]|nr:ATP-binding protein [Agrobacterium sp. S2]
MTEPGTQAFEAAAVEDETYTMTVDLSVLESLGINLYSNAAAVLSELVANAYDADATRVDITWQSRVAPVPLGENAGAIADTTAVVHEVVVSDDAAE